MGSKSGYVDLQVSASTWGGAKEQLERVYGAEQIINLREISNSGGSSSSDSGGLFGLALIVGGIYLGITYWPIVLGLGVLYILYKIFI